MGAGEVDMGRIRGGLLVGDEHNDEEIRGWIKHGKILGVLSPAPKFHP